MATVKIVCGPPCVGKSTYVGQHAGPDDIVLDWDDIVTDLGYPPRHQFVNKSLVGIVTEEWRIRLAKATATDRVVWVIRSQSARQCAPLARSLNAELIELSEPVPVLLERAAHRPHPEEHRRLILAWHGTRRRRR